MKKFFRIKLKFLAAVCAGLAVAAVLGICGAGRAARGESEKGGVWVYRFEAGGMRHAATVEFDGETAAIEDMRSGAASRREYDFNPQNGLGVVYHGPARQVRALVAETGLDESMRDLAEGFYIQGDYMEFRRQGFERMGVKEAEELRADLIANRRAGEGLR